MSTSQKRQRSPRNRSSRGKGWTSLKQHSNDKSQPKISNIVVKATIEHLRQYPEINDRYHRIRNERKKYE